jgi:hypothetical protein
VGKNKHEEYIDDPLLLSLAEINLKEDKRANMSEEKSKAEIEQMLSMILGLQQPTETIDRISRKVLNKVYQPDYNAFTEDEEKMTADFAKEIRDKKVFYDMCKNSQSPSVQELNTQNHLFQYFRLCQRSNVLSLPILFKIRDQRLQLDGYTLNSGICSSFAEAIRTFPNILTSIVLSQNGLKDRDCATILEGMTHLKHVKQIVIKHNELLHESVEQLENLLDKAVPFNLEDLRLVSCKISPLVTS